MGNLGLAGQILVNGIMFGTMYGIAAVGLSLIFGTMRLIFLAQGTLIVFFAYLCYWLLALFGVDPYLSMAIIVGLSLPLGAGLYYGLFREAAVQEDRNTSLLIAVGLMFLVENLMLVFWSPNPRSVVTGYTSTVMQVCGLNVPFTRLVGLVIAVLSAGVVSVFLKKTLIGTAVRAASEDTVATTLMGIDPDRVNAVAFAVGTCMAGIAGVVLATVFPFDPGYGFTFAIKALIALALGGLGSVYGALLGGIVLGVVETTASFYVGGGWAEAISYGVFLLVLTVRPEGLFGGSVRKA